MADASAVRTDRHRRLAWDAQRQLGVFTGRQARDAGYPRSTIRDLVAAGRWRRWYRSAEVVYSDACLPETWEVRLMAAMLALGAEAAVAGRSAAALWQLADLDCPGSLELLLPRRTVPTLDGVTVRGTGWLPADHVVRLGHFRVTTVTRTVRDLAGRIPEAQLLEAAADGLRRRLTDPDLLVGCVVARPRSPGNRALSSVVAELDDAYRRARSVREIRAHRQLKAAGVTGYELNARVVLSSGRTVEFDLTWRDLRFAIELDSERHHGRLTARRRDQQRDRDAARDGWLVVRVRTEVLDRPDRFVATVRAALLDARRRRRTT